MRSFRSWCKNNRKFRKYWYCRQAYSGEIKFVDDATQVSVEIEQARHEQ